MRSRSFLASLALAPIALVIGCAVEDPPGDDLASTEQAVSTPLFEMPQNGYSPDGIAPNYPLLWTVWQHPLDDAGVALTLATTTTAYGVSTAVSSLFNTGNPTTSAEYLMDEIVSCALDSGNHVRATVRGTTFQWEGKFGLCDTGSPFGDWRTSGVSLSCRYIVSACILARMNARSKHVPISVRVPDEIGMFPVDASKFHPVNKVRVQTMLRSGATVASGWQPDFVGICTRGRTVTLQRTSTEQAIRVCTGIHACNLGQQEPVVPGSPRIYSGFLAAFGTGSAPITFTCPRNAGTAPNGKPDRAYFSIMVSPGGAGGTVSPYPWLVPLSDSTTTYPAPERDVFTYPEGGFYGDLFPNVGVGVDTASCYSPLWRDGRMYETYRVCTDPHAGCFIDSGPCQRDCRGRSSSPDEAYYDCLSDVDVPRWTGVTVFLNEPSAIASDVAPSAIESIHDVCTSGAPLVNDGTSDVVRRICDPNQDPYCCSAAWDSRCVSEVRTVASSQECSATPCIHPVCTTGTALTNGCSPVVSKVCTVDPYCCQTAWDGICVQEVQTVANNPACGCSHAVCTTGAKLNNGCSPVVTSVCAVDAFCCNTAWDSTCVQEVQTVANSPACACSHAVCTIGAALNDRCSPVVTSVCAADPYCCQTAWDGICVQEVQTVANSPECK